MRVEDDGEEIEIFTHGRSPFLRTVRWADYSGAGGGGGAFTEADFEAWLAHDFEIASRETRAEAARNVLGVADPEMRQAVLDGVEAGLQGQVAIMRNQIGRQRREIEAEMGRPFSQSPRGDAPTAGAGAYACWMDYQIVESASCPLSQRLVALDPDYFDAARPGAIQLVLVRTSTKPEQETGEAYAERRAIWRALDRNALGAMTSGD